MHTSVRLLTIPAQVFTDVNLRSQRLRSNKSNAGTAITGGLWLRSPYVMRGSHASARQNHAVVLPRHIPGRMHGSRLVRSVEA